jgi:hypothetical protein
LIVIKVQPILKLLFQQKINRRRRGLQHLISTKDQIVLDCCPPEINYKEFVEECESAVNRADLQSDEYSSDDEQLANQERQLGKRNVKNEKTNSIIRVKDKAWRSTRVSSEFTLYK